MVKIVVPTEVQFYPWFAVFDFESIKEITDDHKEKLHWTAKHIPVSFSVSSNAPGFTTISCTVVPDLDLLVAALVANLSEIQINAYELAKDMARRL